MFARDLRACNAHAMLQTPTKCMTVRRVVSLRRRFWCDIAHKAMGKLSELNELDGKTCKAAMIEDLMLHGTAIAMPSHDCEQLHKCCIRDFGCNYFPLEAQLAEMVAKHIATNCSGLLNVSGIYPGVRGHKRIPISERKLRN